MMIFIALSTVMLMCDIKIAFCPSVCHSPVLYWNGII